MNATNAVKLGNVYISKDDVVNITCKIDSKEHDITGRIIGLTDDWMLLDDSKVYYGSKFQAYYNTLTGITIISTPAVTL